MRWQWDKPEDHPLRRYARARGWSDNQVMNTLQDHGIVSDNAVTIDDVGNYARAMMWLHEKQEARQGIRK
jgi:hypothetical protein